MKHPIYIIAACDANHGIGKNGDLPWQIKDDLRHFQKITTETKNPNKQNIVIMGRKTWESLPKKHRPLKNRLNIILTRNTKYKEENTLTATSIKEAFKFANEKIEQIFIIGGGSIYKETISLPEITGLYLTEINQEFDCDTYFPQIPKQFSLLHKIGEGEENGINFKYKLYLKNQHKTNIQKT